MRVLVSEHHHRGHYYRYLSHLVPAVAAVASETVVAVTREGRASPEFSTYLQPLAGIVRFEEILPSASPWVPMQERWQVHRDVRRAILDLDPDYVLMPSGDGPATLASVFRMIGRGAMPRRIPCEVGIHFGSGLTDDRSVRVRDWMNQLNLALGGFARVHLANVLFYEQARSHGFGRTFTLMPDAVLPNPRLDKAESRRRLGIPADGRYIGLAASLDSRKAIGPMLAAFRAASSSRSERVLLAGRISDAHLKTIQESFQDLVDEERLILIKGFISPETFQTVLTALDVVCTPYPGFGGLSGTVLEAVSAGRPILAHAYGWSKAMVRRFALGWTCDVLDHAAFTGTIRTALDRCDDYTETEAIRRLLRFHLPENFARTWVEGIRSRNRLTNPDAHPWSWVVEAIPPPLRTSC